MRRYFGIMLAATVVIGTVGCTPRQSGITGISVDAEGHPTVVIAWCGDAPNRVVVTHQESVSGTPETADPENSNLPPLTAKTRSIKDVTFRVPSLAGQSLSIRLDSPGKWIAEPGPLTLKPGVTYTAFGGSADNESTSFYVDFTSDDLVNLKPGTVWLQDYDEKTENWNDAVISQEEFERRGQSSSSCS